MVLLFWKGVNWMYKILDRAIPGLDWVIFPQMVPPTFRLNHHLFMQKFKIIKQITDLEVKKWHYKTSEIFFKKALFITLILFYLIHIFRLRWNNHYGLWGVAGAPRSRRHSGPGLQFTGQPGRANNPVESHRPSERR